MNKQQTKLLVENWRNLINERNFTLQFDTPLSAWLCGVNTTNRLRFGKISNMGLFEKLKSRRSFNNNLVAVSVYDKNEFIFNKINENCLKYTGEELICNANKEQMFNDTAPILIVKNIGNFANLDKGHIDINENIDWITHDLFHLFFDANAPLQFDKKFDDYLHGDKHKAGFKLSSVFNAGDINDQYAYEQLEEDAITFLNNKNFTLGVGKIDFYASLAAYTLMHRNKPTLAEEDLNGMINKKLFKKIYNIIYNNSYSLVESFFKEYENTIMCINLPS